MSHHVELIHPNYLADQNSGNNKNIWTNLASSKTSYLLKYQETKLLLYVK